MKQPNPTHVYVLGFTDRVVKVGRTSNPESRRRAHVSDGLIRRAAIKQEWWLETDRAKEAEWLLKVLGPTEMAPLSGTEYFRGDFDRFMAVVIHRFERAGFLPIESCSFLEAVERTGVPSRSLLSARMCEEIAQDVNLPGAMGLRFVVSELDEWADRYWREEMSA